MHQEHFFQWYLVKAPRFLSMLFKNYTWHFWNLFAISRHGRQLLLPWKRIYQVRQKPGFDLHETVEIISFNIISRVIGFILRVVVIVLGLLTLFLNVIFWVIVTAVFFIFVPFSFLFFLIWKSKQSSVDAFRSIHSGADFAQVLKKSADTTYLLQRFGQADITAEFFTWLSTQPIELSESLLKDLEQSKDIDIHLLTMFKWLLSDNQSVNEWFRQKGILVEDAQEVVTWYLLWKIEEKKSAQFWTKASLQKTPSIGKDWGYGFTPLIDKFTDDMSDDLHREFIFNPRNDEVEKLEEFFSKQTKTQVLLVGQPGVGKKTVCHFLAKKISEGHTTPSLSDHRVLLLNMEKVLGEGNKDKNPEQLLREILTESGQAGNVILVIDQFDRYVGQGQDLHDFSGIFHQVGQQFPFKLLALTTEQGMRDQITPNAVIFELFEVMPLKPTSTDETIHLLFEVSSDYEKARHVQIHFPALKEIVSQSQHVMTNIPFPEKALIILDEALAVSQQQQLPHLTKETVDKVISQKTGVQIGIWTDQQKDLLSHLEEKLHERIIGQDEAVKTVAESIRTAQVRLGSGHKTIGALLFLGTTGVGKTEMAKSVADIYFQNRDALIRVDFGEYTEERYLVNLIGTPNEGGRLAQGGQLTEAVRSKPSCVVLFDEMEKAHPKILNALFTIFDEGYLTDARGEQISFHHTIVIATSNAASELIRSLYEQGVPQSELSQQVLNHLIQERIFLPEFLNRFDGVVFFTPLSQTEVSQIASIKLAQLKEKVRAEHGVLLEFDDAYIQKIAQQGYNPQFGARYLERIINDQVVDVLAKALIDGSVKPGSTFRLS